MISRLPKKFWSAASEDVLRALESSPDGLAPTEAARRLEIFGSNLLKKKRKTDSVTLPLGSYQEGKIRLA